MRQRWLLLIGGLFASAVALTVSAGLFSAHDAAANPMAGVVSIAAVGDHTCAIMTTSSVRCWGHNNDGQLGNGHEIGPFRAEAVPSEPVLLEGAVVAIGSGLNHTCAILEG